MTEKVEENSFPASEDNVPALTVIVKKGSENYEIIFKGEFIVCHSLDEVIGWLLNQK